jgi:pimeloyl-ACP methyl ester carboxylesterase
VGTVVFPYLANADLWFANGRPGVTSATLGDVLVWSSFVPENYGADRIIADLLHQLVDRFPTSKIGLVGHGRGALAAMMTAHGPVLQIREILALSPALEGQIPWPGYGPLGKLKRLTWVESAFDPEAPLAQAQFGNIATPESVFAPVLLENTWTAWKAETEARVDALVGVLLV